MHKNECREKKNINVGEKDEIEEGIYQENQKGNVDKKEISGMGRKTTNLYTFMLDNVGERQIS